MSKAVVPELRFPEFEGEWTVEKLGNHISLQSGFAFSSQYFGIDGMKLVTPKNFTKSGNANFNNRNTKFTTQQADKQFICTSGDLLVLLTDLTPSCELLGKPLKLNSGDGKVLLNQRIVRIDENKLSINSEFLKNYFLTENYHRYVVSTASGTTVRHTSNKVLKACLLGLTTLPEQKKIAGFLLAVDEKLAAVEAQLMGWRDYKRGMMQALFSQTLRFKADDGSTFPVWSNVKLEDRFSFHKTNSLSRAVLGRESDGIENIHYGDIHTKYRAQFDIRNESTGIIPSHLTDKAGEPLKKGDVIFADASEDYNDVGKAIEVINLDNRAVVAGLHTIVARPKKDTIALGFAAYLFASWPLRKQLMRIANGASVLGISKTNLAKVDLTLPSLPEQQKIADALSAIDAKIEALTNRLDATREFKRGLLQKMFV